RAGLRVELPALVARARGRVSRPVARELPLVIHATCAGVTSARDDWQGLPGLRIDVVASGPEDTVIGDVLCTNPTFVIDVVEDGLRKRRVGCRRIHRCDD